MAEIGGIQQSLAQTQALEGVQEAARRRGEQQQQAFAVTLNRQVDAREHQVTEGEGPLEEELDPNAQKRKRDEAGAGEREAGAEAAPLLPEDEEEGRGRHVDARA